ncbi:hypothetical protein D6C77_09890 [Aureobasidium pullulans]|nr:hypothetical protein D6C77_09890 [Aureobasidium pullulans]
MAELSKLLETINIDWDPVQYRTCCFGHQNNLILQAFWNHATEEAIEQAKQWNPDDVVAVIARKDTGWAADRSVRLLECLMKTIKSTRRLAQKLKLLTGLVPITNNSTRWNSYCRMFERALACHETLSEWQWKYPELRKFALHKGDWLVIQKSYDFLKQFLVLTKETEGDGSTLEQVIIAMNYLRVHYDEAVIEHAGDTPFLTALQSSRYVYESWYAINDHTPAYQSAILLHPSYRPAYIDYHWPDEWR